MPRAIHRYGARIRSLIPPPSPSELNLLISVRPYTLLGFPQLRTIYRLARQLAAEQVPGAFVECGTANGGIGAILARVARSTDRHVWLFDSFESLPPPTAADGYVDPRWIGQLGQEGMVQRILQRVGANMEAVHVVKGWFEATLPPAPTGTIALLHVDGDWYESVMTTLINFYDRVHPDGFLVVDDYGRWPGCKKAVDEFLSRRLVSPVMRSANLGASVWFRKP